MARYRLIICVPILLLIVGSASAQDQAALRQQAEKALRKAVEFYRTQVSSEGGYHFDYAEDLSYGRSEISEGRMQVEVQREGTPLVGMTYLRAYEATGDRYYLDAAVEVARFLVKGQLCSGGWQYFIDLDPARRSRYAYKVDGNCGGKASNVTTLDDNVTQAAVRLLMRVDAELGFRDQSIHAAATGALDSLARAQYPNGAWPQRYDQPPDPAKFPVMRASYPETWSRVWPGEVYQSHYTFNDNTTLDVIDTFLEAARIYQDSKYQATAEKGGQFILLAQMPEPQPAWAQQYDSEMHPAWARVFEPPSVTGGESQSILKMLLVLYQETGKREYLDAVPRALVYLQRSILPPPEKPSEAFARAARSGPVVARFYELKTNRPLYITKGTMVNVKGRPGSRLDGYELTYDDASVITHYGVLTSGRELAQIAREYERVSKAKPGDFKRPAKLHTLSPWDDKPRPAPSAEDVRRAIDSMDTRGAWVEEGTIGKADRIVYVFPAREMVVKVGKRTFPLQENETVEVFQGPQPPRERIISSATFARNVEAFCEFLKSGK